MANPIDVVPADDNRATPPGADPSLGELFKQLAQDSSTLVKQEITLAKAEITENLQAMGKAAALMAAGGAVLLVGVLVLTAFFVILLGDAFDNYWLGALIAGLIYVVIGAILLAQGRNKMKHEDLKPERTLETLREDKRWAQAEAKDVKRELTS